MLVEPVLKYQRSAVRTDCARCEMLEVIDVDQLPNNLVYGYHGTTSDFAEAHLRDGIPSTSFSGDWLGHGSYFWQGDVDRATEWAEHSAAKSRSNGNQSEPVVLEAVIDLSECLDLTKIAYRDALRTVADDIISVLAPLEREAIRQNKGRRELDCKVINAFLFDAANGGMPRFTTVRGVFSEGDPLYSIDERRQSGICDRDHIQINVVNKIAIRSLCRV